LLLVKFEHKLIYCKTFSYSHVRTLTFSWRCNGCYLGT